MYNNEYGQFSDDGKEYIITENKNNRTPLAWSHILTNDEFGTVITNGMGGFTWYKNSKTNKITKFTNDAFKDCSSENIIFKDNNKDWSIDAYTMPDDGDYRVKYGFGYAVFGHESNGIEQQLEIFVPNDINAKTNIIRLKNITSENKKIEIKYNLDFIIGERESNYINEEYKENLNMIIVYNNVNMKYLTYITSNEKINNNKEVVIELEPKEEKEIVLVLGCEEIEENCIKSASVMTNNYNEKLKQTKDYWKKLTSMVSAKTPLESFNIMQNGFLVYQTIASRMKAKTGFYQVSGGYGYRDQLQDAMGMKWTNPNILKEQILKHAAHQFIEGDVEHWWHDETELGIRSRYSDDMLWLPYAVLDYIEFTGNEKILKKKVNYVEGKTLLENEVDRVDYYYTSEKEGTILEHCIKAINKAMKFGKNKLPLIEGGDWNDGMNMIGQKHIGESIWLGFFLYDIIKRFVEYIKNDKQKKEFVEIAIQLKKALNTIGWNGRWYIRAIKDDGNKVGSNECEECKIDSISQSFSVISEAGDNDKKIIAMKSLEKMLIDNNSNTIKLLTPALENENLGYISSYGKGMRENGGQYTHAAIWALIAEAILENNNVVYEMYKKINPIEHSKTKEEANIYKVEPYVVAADIYSEGKLAGRGGWTWYTGSSSWLYEAQIKYILGIKIKKGIMNISPCIPDQWDEFSVKLKWKNATYNINYKRRSKKLKKENKPIILQNIGEWNIEIYY